MSSSSPSSCLSVAAPVVPVSSSNSIVENICSSASPSPVLDCLLGADLNNFDRTALAELDAYLATTKDSFSKNRRALAQLYYSNLSASSGPVPIKPEPDDLVRVNAYVKLWSQETVQKFPVVLKKLRNPANVLSESDVAVVRNIAERVIDVRPHNIKKENWQCGPVVVPRAVVVDTANKLLLLVAQRLLVQEVQNRPQRSIIVNQVATNTVFLHVTPIFGLYIFLHNENLHAFPLEKIESERERKEMHWGRKCHYIAEHLAGAVPEGDKNPEYLSGSHMSFLNETQVIEGAYLLVSILSAVREKAFFEAQIQKYPVGVGQDRSWQEWIVDKMTEILCQDDPAFEACRRRLIDEQKGRVIFLTKYHGLTHPEYVFPCARQVVPVLDPTQQDLIVEAVMDHLKSCDDVFQAMLSGHVVPFTFPPMLADEEKMARNLLALDAPFESDEDAKQYFAERLGEMGISPGDIAAEDLDFADRAAAPKNANGSGDSDDFPHEFTTDDPVLVRAREMAERALRALRDAELEEKRLREEADRAVAIKAEQEARAEAIKAEQEEIANRWKNHSGDSGDGGGGAIAGTTQGTKKRVNKSKNQKKKDAREKDAIAEVVPKNSLDWAKQRYSDTKGRFSALLRGFAGKVAKLRHYHKGLRALGRAGILNNVDLELQNGSHRVLHARDMLPLTVALPHGRTAERALRLT